MNYHVNKDDHLEHHGILGQKWGVRRYQNKDGSYTNAGKSRYKEKMNSSVNKSKELVKSGADKANKRINNINRDDLANAVKKPLIEKLDKMEDDNFFNSESIFSRESMTKQAKIDAARTFVEHINGNTFTVKGAKESINLGKSIYKQYLDDMDDVDFFNSDWDTRMKNEERRDRIRDHL